MHSAQSYSVSETGFLFVPKESLTIRIYICDSNPGRHGQQQQTFTTIKTLGTTKKWATVSIYFRVVFTLFFKKKIVVVAGAALAWCYVHNGNKTIFGVLKIKII